MLLFCQNIALLLSFFLFFTLSLFLLCPCFAAQDEVFRHRTSLVSTFQTAWSQAVQWKVNRKQSSGSKQSSLTGPRLQLSTAPSLKGNPQNPLSILLRGMKVSDVSLLLILRWECFQVNTLSVCTYLILFLTFFPPHRLLSLCS